MTEINVGTCIAGRYRVLELIGSGGMANVYRALDTDSRRDVAVKVLKPECAEDREFLRRFRSEAQAVLNLSHDNIVRSFDVGQWEGYHYIVLEYVPGKTLKQVITEEAPFDNKRIINIGCQLCDALGHAHERSIIHRDVKPQNIMISDRGRVKVADFGIARFTDASTVTYAGDKILGSVHYLSPEQARGESVDAKSDIYSLGIVLYEMATGVVPFNADNTVSIAIKHLQENMVPPIERNPALGAALNGIILRATAKDKAERYSSMRELRKDLLRAVREPNVDFAGKAAQRSREPRGLGPLLRAPKKRGQKAPASAVAKRIMALAVGVFLIAGILLAVVLIGSTLSNRQNRGQVAYVPTLTGKSLSEATQTGSAMGFHVDVRSSIVTEDVPTNTVINQDPQSGTQGYVGDTIYVDVSAGPATIEAPELIGRTLSDALVILEEWELEVESITYDPTSDAPSGQIIDQLPEAGTELYAGDAVQLFVSGTQEDHTILSKVTGLPLADAVNRLKNDGFSRIFVRLEESDELPGEVLRQEPAPGELTAGDATVDLWVSAPLSYAYGLDVAYNLKIDQTSSRVMVLNPSDGVYYVLYEAVLPAGQQTVSFTVRSNSADPVELIVTVDGEEARRESVTPVRRVEEAAPSPSSTAAPEDGSGDE